MSEPMEKDPIEDIINALPLRSPSQGCDEKVLSWIRESESINNGELANAGKLESDVESESAVKPKNAHPIAKSSQPFPALTKLTVATAAALLIGFCLGTMVKLNLDKTYDESSFNTTSKEESVIAPPPFELSENVTIKNGESKTYIVEDRLQFQDNLPVRKLETVTRKKVLLKNASDDSEQEIEIPIRKVFLTPAETI